MKLLIIEDDFEVLELLKDLAISAGYEVKAFDNAKDALEAYSHEFFPLIVTDLGMAGIDGWEFCRRIRQMPNGEYSVILAESGFVEPYKLKGILDAGADDYIQKPIDLQRFLIRLEVAERLVKERLARRKVEREQA